MDEDGLGMINIFELNKKRDEKVYAKISLFKSVLKRIHNRIQKVAAMNETYCFFIVPEYIPGLPKYDTLEVASFCVKKLKQNGFLVRYTYPNLIYISWEHVPSEVKCPEVKDIQLELETNPAANYNKLIQNIKGANLYTPGKPLTHLKSAKPEYRSTGVVSVETPGLKAIEDIGFSDSTSYGSIVPSGISSIYGYPNYKP